ncbi:MAG: hypothetical protein PHW54_02615 [Candidatus Omnitrophica bacterium]|nr:hypothetical protein [Candidatus Omnitrophota bacterium]
MKLYKFRSLTGTERDIDSNRDSDFKRAKMILENGEFWCSKFSELNDPMEGVFYGSKDLIDTIYTKKLQYKICSFSAKRALEKPYMWGYYANGFKGMAIEIEVDSGDVEEINYSNKIPSVDHLRSVCKTDDEVIVKIITIKSSPWKREAEYRFLIKDEKKYHKIGEITKVYFGNPYGGVDNKESIYKNNPSLLCYDKFKKYLIRLANERNISCYSIKIKDGKVLPDEKL